MQIDIPNISTHELESYDDMMTESAVHVHKFSTLAVAVWTEVLKELDKRGRVELVSGSYDRIGDALIRRVR